MGTTQLLRVLEVDGMKPSERLVLTELAYRADRKGVIRESQGTIAEYTGLSRSTVGREMDLQVANLVLVKQGHGRYRLNPAAWQSIECLEEYLHG